MSDHVYKLVEITGSSNSGVEDAVRGALGRASKSLRNLKWFEVTNIRGTIEKDKIAHWQVTMKVGFTLED